MGIAAARAGKHVIVEKPIDITLSKADKLIGACREAGVKLELPASISGTMGTGVKYKIC
jgi:predicted dehydrogenase